MNFFHKFTLLVGAMLGIGCCIGTGRPSNPDPGPANLVKNSTIAFVGKSDEGLKPFCGGIWVSREWILTAFHCVRDESRVMTYIDPGDAAEGEPENSKVRLGYVAAWSRQTDLALIYDPNPPSHPFVHVTNDSHENVGKPVHVMGHTMGYWWSYSRGYVSREFSSESPSGNRVKVLQISAPVWMGNSGGGAFDDSGKLIGISSWVSKSGPSLSFFIHPTEIRKFIESVTQKLEIESLLESQP